MIMEEEDEEAKREDEHAKVEEVQVLETPPTKSHLPSWVLRMRDKISESRVAHAQAEARITQLNKDVNILSEKISLLRPKPGPPPSAVDTSSSLGQTNVVVENFSDRFKLTLPSLFYFDTMPCDTLCHVLSLLLIDEVVQLESACKCLKLRISTNLFWFRLHPLFFPLRRQYAFAADAVHTDTPIFDTHIKFCRREIGEYLSNVYKCVKFLHIMKEQRSIPKYRSVEPHRHSKNETSITHPLPIFDSPNQIQRVPHRRLDSRSNHSNYQPQSQQMIMSRSETLNKDFSSYAHSALQKMFDLTADSDNLVNCKLARAGAVTVLISLLANEEGALQNYSCGLLANLLCWEARRRRPVRPVPSSDPISLEDDRNWEWECWTHQRSRENWLCTHIRMFNDLDMNSIDSSPSRASDSRNAWIQLSAQIDACGGIKQLTSLLTSPSASINLAGSAAKSSGGFKELRMTASVQGVATKQASRALISLFYPRMCIPAPLPQVSEETGPSRALISSCGGESSKSAAIHGKSTAPLAHMTTNRNLLSTPSIGGLFVSDDRPIPWQFTYYYKSGSLKDQFNVYMRFLPDGFCRGRGMDSIGPFLLRGKVDPDISGFVWYFHKSYLRQVALLDVDISSWLLQQEDDEDLGACSGDGRKLPIHVSHTGYWSDGVDLVARAGSCRRLGLLLHQLRGVESSRWEEEQEQELEDGQTGMFPAQDEDTAGAQELSDEHEVGVWGLGLWGVWETASSSAPHFELQKGGVFRAAPILASEAIV